MTAFIPTTTITIYRGESTDAFGDPVDNNVAIATEVPAAISETLPRWFRPDEQRGGVVDKYTIRLRPNISIQEGDRLLDERTDVTYLVQSVEYQQSIVGLADIRVIAQQVGALSQPVNG